MLRRLPRRAAAKKPAPHLADSAIVPPLRRADDRVTVNPHVLLQRVSAGRLSGALDDAQQSRPPMTLANMRERGATNFD